MESPTLLQDLANQAKSQEGASTFMEPGVRKGPQGRHKKDCGCANCQAKKAPKSGTASANTQNQQAPIAGPNPSAEMLKPFFKFCSDTAVDLTGEKSAAMSDPQMEGCATYGGIIMDKYAPMISQKWGAEIAFCVMFGSWGLGVYRIYVDKKKKILEMQKKNQKTNEHLNGNFNGNIPPDVAGFKQSVVEIRTPNAN